MLCVAVEKLMNACSIAHHAIMMPLSVHSRGGGTWRVRL